MNPDISLLLSTLEDVTAALETVIAHQGIDMPPHDLDQRTQLVNQARAIIQQFTPKPT